jgi:amino acid permease
MVTSNTGLGDDFKSIGDSKELVHSFTSWWFWIPFFLGLGILYAIIIGNKQEELSISAFIGINLTIALIVFVIAHVIRRKKSPLSLANKSSKGGEQSIYSRFPSLAGIAAESRNEVLGGISNPFYMN